MATSRTKTLVTVFLMLDLLCMVVFSASVGSRSLLSDERPDFIQDAEDQINGFADSVWGGKCVTNDQCSFLSFCNKEQSIVGVAGECQIVWWAYIVVGLVVLLLLSCCISCLCCPCCFLYHCCSKILDCLCCCCRSKGYSPASRG